MSADIVFTIAGRGGGSKRPGSLSFKDRRTWLALAAIALVGGAALNWSWLVAAGIAPLLLALAPCAAMCALGVCMKSGANRCNQQDADAGPTPAPLSIKTDGLGRA